METKVKISYLNSPKMPAPEENKNNKLDQIDVPTREISQTDHINKKLLTSLFKRMDEGNDSILEKMLESDNNSEDNDEWKD